MLEGAVAFSCLLTDEAASAVSKAFGFVDDEVFISLSTSTVLLLLEMLATIWIFSIRGDWAVPGVVPADERPSAWAGVAKVVAACRPCKVLICLFFIAELITDETLTSLATDMLAWN